MGFEWSQYILNLSHMEGAAAILKTPQDCKNLNTSLHFHGGIFQFNLWSSAIHNNNNDLSDTTQKSLLTLYATCYNSMQAKALNLLILVSNIYKLD